VRLLVITHYFWPENFRINDLVAELARRGHSVTVLAGLPSYPEGEIFPQFRANPAAFDRYAGVEVVRVPGITRGRAGSRVRLALNYLSYALSAAIIGSWKLRGRAFDAIFAYQPSPATTGLPAVILRFLKRAPLAFWVLDLWPATLQAMGVLRSPAALRAVGRFMAAIYNRCDLILAQSRSFIGEIARYCREPKPIHYFPSWAEAVFDMRSVQPAPEVPASPGALTIMFAGNIGEAQDFPAVLDAAELLRDQPHVRWVFVGDGSMARWVAQEIVRRQLDGRVLLTGRYPVERMPSFYRHADALLMSLRDEPIFAMTIPGKLQTYLAAGLPVLAMLNGEGADVVTRSRCGLACRAGDARGLADAVLRLASLTPEQRAEMGRAALAASTSEFDRSALLTQLEGWLTTMAATASGKLAAPRANAG
jgi:glycosyltransferase involved in cell wall biosynthesis